MKTILIADDAPHLLMLLEHHLKKANYALETASSGEEALTKAQAHPIDLMLIDVDLPGIDGIETVRRLKKLPGYAALPVIVMTGGSGNGTRARAHEAGATSFFSKPYSPKDLLDQVALLLRF
jgi:two-component system chemotaxis response regulator CheY